MTNKKFMFFSFTLITFELNILKLLEIFEDKILELEVKFRLFEKFKITADFCL